MNCSGRFDASVARETRGQHVVVIGAEDAPGLDRTSFQLMIRIANEGAASVSIATAADDAAWAATVDRAMEPSIDKGWGDERVADSVLCAAPSSWVVDPPRWQRTTH